MIVETESQKMIGVDITVNSDITIGDDFTIIATITNKSSSARLVVAVVTYVCLQCISLSCDCTGTSMFVLSVGQSSTLEPQASKSRHILQESK